MRARDAAGAIAVLYIIIILIIIIKNKDDDGKKIIISDRVVDRESLLAQGQRRRQDSEH